MWVTKNCSFLRYVFVHLLSVYFTRGTSVNKTRTMCLPLLSDVETPSIRIPNFGTLHGSTTVSYWKKRPIFQYLAIPFAEPPIGNLRFQPPRRKKETQEDESYYDAKMFQRKCPQLANPEDYYHLTRTKDPIEDCLYLNVFVPQVPQTMTKPLPVMVFIHGGAFLQGSAVNFCPNYLLDYDVILVTLQYRLGPLGFLCLHTENAPGNVGFLDQIMALEWINENIAQFGGDKNRVTLFGESAGSVSASLFLVSPFVKPGLFQQVIMQSGNLLWSDWYIDKDPVSSARSYAKYLNCTQENTNELADCLKTVPAADLITSNIRYMYNTVLKGKRASLNIGIAQAVVQKVGDGKFLTENPVDTFKSGKFIKLPIIHGFTKDEGSMFFKIFYEYILKAREGENCFERNNCVSEEYVKDEIFYDYLTTFGLSEQIPILELVKDTYFPQKARGNLTATAPGFANLIGNLLIKMPSIEFARSTFTKMPTYLYTFNFEGTHSLINYGKTTSYPFPTGVAHTDDLLYLFPYIPETLNNEEAAVARTICSLWTSFAINNGQPAAVENVNWPAVSNKYGPYLVIDRKLHIDNDILKEYSHAYKLTPNIILYLIVFSILSSCNKVITSSVQQ